jgi:hypothetical protein
MNMALPINASPTYTLTIPSLKKEVKYRQFLVKEEKALLMAQQSEDPQVMVDTLKTVINACVTGDYRVDDLALFDLEYIFTQLRAKSVGETVDLIFACDEDHGSDNERAKVKISFDISKLEIDINPEHQKNIPLFNEVGVVMTYPNFKSMRELQNVKTENLDEIFKVVANCVDYIYDGEKIYHAKDQTKEEILEFLNNLTSDQFKNVQKFFETMPRLRKEVDYNCPVCGKSHHKVLEGLQSFF